MATKRTVTTKLPSTVWWQQKPDEMGYSVARMIEAFKREQSGRRIRYKRNLELYEQRNANDAGSFKDVGVDFAQDRLGLIRSAVGTAVSSIYAPQKPKPQFQTSGATWNIRRRAAKLDKICEGIINQRQGRWINVWALMTDAGAEAAVQGCACIKVYSDMANKRVAHKLIPCIDIWYDPTEGRTPHTQYHREPISESDALTLWPKKAAAIKGAQPYEWNFGQAQKPRDSKTIELQYAYKLPDSSDEPGKWCAAIGGEVVDSGEWDAPAFPIVVLGWEPHRDSPWYSGIADEGAGQAEFCSELYLRLRYRCIIASGQKVYYQKDTVKADDLAVNDARVAIPYEGSTPPIDTVVTPFSPVEMEFLQYSVQNFWDAIGISQVSAAARREQGVSSGVAMMTLNDTKAGRQLTKAQRYEQAYVDLANQYVWRLRELAKDNKDLMVQWPGKKLLMSVKFSDADVEDEMFTVSVAPASALPHDPAGRQQMVSELYQQGMISQETAKTLIGWPDLDNELNLETSAQEYIDALIERYLDADPETWTSAQYQAPSGNLPNKPTAMLRMISALYKARTDQFALTPEESAKAEFNMNLLGRWILEMDNILNPKPTEEQKAAAAAAAQGGGMPPGPGAPLPPGALPPPAPTNLPAGAMPPPGAVMNAA